MLFLYLDDNVIVNIRSEDHHVRGVRIAQTREREYRQKSALLNKQRHCRY
ncbi:MULTISPECIES: hypothetical protein [Symbiopectobacterium]|nr:MULTISPECIES: hypothetical protein [Symbiopectobacterium]MBT9428564.1 hypothetical protein [Candidatus Symbiopectobacterium endolongispinus]